MEVQNGWVRPWHHGKSPAQWAGAEDSLDGLMLRGPCLPWQSRTANFPLTGARVSHFQMLTSYSSHCLCTCGTEGGGVGLFWLAFQGIHSMMVVGKAHWLDRLGLWQLEVEVAGHIMAADRSQRWIKLLRPSLQQLSSSSQASV